MAHRPALALSITAAALLATARPALADRPTARQVVAGTVDRARRSVAIGPLVGVGIAHAPRPGELDVPLSFGLSLALFEIAVVPSPDELRAMIVARARDRVTAKVKAMILRGEPAPDQQELARLGRDAVDEVRAELLGVHQVRGKTLESPRLTLATEVTYRPRAGAWQVRATLGVGIRRFTLGPTLTGDFAGTNGLFVGAELAVHLTPRPGPRPPVIDLYLRFDRGVTRGTRDADQLGAGARYLLDLL